MDTQTAIKALISDRCVFKGSMVAVESVARIKRLHFYWVPGHKCIEENEIVDETDKSNVRLSPENVTNIGKAMHFLFEDLDAKKSHV